MKMIVGVIASSLIVATPAFASHHHWRIRHHHETLTNLEREVASLRREIASLRHNDAWHGVPYPQIPFGIAMASLDVGGDLGSVAAKVTTAALEVPENLVIKPLTELADSISLDNDRSYLVETACPGYTMHRQGVPLSIERLNPTFVRRLAAAFREAREEKMEPCIFSAYRPPSYGVGGFRDKFHSAHSYGLAVDLDGIGRQGSKTTKRWREVAAKHDLYGPYSVYSRSEWNHFQCTPLKMVTLAAPLRGTITARGPISLQKMWHVADAIIPGPGKHIAEPRRVHSPRGRRHRHYVRRHRHVIAYLAKS